MDIDTNQFFREATLRICGSLDLASAMQQCLLYIGNHIPASMTCAHIYDRELGIVETVAWAGVDFAETTNLRTPLPEEGRRQVELRRSQRIWVAARMADDAVGAESNEK